MKTCHGIMESKRNSIHRTSWNFLADMAGLHKNETIMKNCQFLNFVDSPRSLDLFQQMDLAQLRCENKAALPWFAMVSAPVRMQQATKENERNIGITCNGLVKPCLKVLL